MHFIFSAHIYKRSFHLQYILCPCFPDDSPSARSSDICSPPRVHQTIAAYHKSTLCYICAVSIARWLLIQAESDVVCVCVMRVFFHIFLHCTWASCMPKEWQRIRRELRVHYMLYSIVHAKKRVSARILRNECLHFMVGVWLASYTHMHYICLPVYI